MFAKGAKKCPRNVLKILENLVGGGAVEDLVVVPEVRGHVKLLEGLLAKERHVASEGGKCRAKLASSPGGRGTSQIREYHDDAVRPALGARRSTNDVPYRRLPIAKTVAAAVPARSSRARAHSLGRDFESWSSQSCSSSSPLSPAPTTTRAQSRSFQKPSPPNSRDSMTKRDFNGIFAKECLYSRIPRESARHAYIWAHNTHARSVLAAFATLPRAHIM